MSLLISVLRILAIISVCGVVYASPTEHLLAYKAFKDALQAGQLDAARNHAERAWVLAEKEKATPETRAVLAHNFSEITILEDPQRALPALKQAVALGQEGYGLANYSLLELQLYHAYGEAKLRPGRSNLRHTLLNAINAYRASGGGLNKVISPMLFDAAVFSYDAGDSDTAEVISTMLSHYLEALDVVPAEYLATVNLMRVAAMLSGEKYKPRSSKLTEEYIATVQDAHILIDYTLTLLTPPTSIDVRSYDGIYAQVIAWRGVVKALQSTFDIKMDNLRFFEGKQFDETFVPSTIDRRDEYGEEFACELTWLTRKVNFPSISPRRGRKRIGALLLGFNLSEDGRVEGARVLAEVPAEEFSSSILRQAKKWRADMSTLNDKHCLNDHVLSIILSLAD